MIGKTRKLCRTLGTANALLYLTSRLLETVSRGQLRLIRYLIVAQPVAPGPLPGCRPSADARVEHVLPGSPLCAAFPRPPEVIARRFANGDTCLAATVKGRFAGFLWYARGHYEEDEVRCNYRLADPAAAVWDYDVYVEPEFRLGRTLGRLWSAAHERLRADGIRWSFSRISAFNPDSLNAHLRLGARRIGALSFLCIGRMQIALGLPGRRVHLSFAARSRPEYFVSPLPPPQNTG